MLKITVVYVILKGKSGDVKEGSRSSVVVHAREGGA